MPSPSSGNCSLPTGGKLVRMCSLVSLLLLLLSSVIPDRWRPAPIFTKQKHPLSQFGPPACTLWSTYSPMRWAPIKHSHPIIKPSKHPYSPPFLLYSLKRRNIPHGYGDQKLASKKPTISVPHISHAAKPIAAPPHAFTAGVIVRLKRPSGGGSAPRGLMGAVLICISPPSHLPLASCLPSAVVRPGAAELGA